MNLLIITGMSGAGKTTSMKVMEDMGYFCIDNLPVTLIDKLVDFSYTMPSENTKMAVGIDIRNGSILNETKRVLENLKQKQVNYEILFLDAEDEVLVKRYKETRRNHPLADGERVEQGIRKERVRLEELKKQATYILDTSQLLTRELKMELEKIFIKNEKFQNYVADVAAQAMNTTAADIDAFLAEAWALDTTKTVKEALAAQIAVIGENMNIRRFERLHEENGFVQAYIHGGGRIGVLWIEIWGAFWYNIGAIIPGDGSDEDGQRKDKTVNPCEAGRCGDSVSADCAVRPGAGSWLRRGKNRPGGLRVDHQFLRGSQRRYLQVRLRL